MSSAPLRVLMTTDAVGGVWTYAGALARTLCRRGHEVTLVTMGPAPRRDQVEEASAIPGLSVDVTGLALEWVDPEGRDLPRARDTLLSIADRVRPDLIHLNSYREATFGFCAPVLVVAHSCVGSWWQACRPHQPLEPRWQTYLRNVAEGLDAADRWAAPTLSYRDWIQAFYRPRSRGEAVWNGADPTSSDVLKERRILAAGRAWDEAKNMRILARVANETDWPVSVAGPLRSIDSTDTDAEIDKLHVVGELTHDELLAQMQRAGIFVAPAIYEPFGLGILEAAACGCALVLSDIDSLRELWRGAALFVEPSSAGAVRDALNTLCRDDDLRQRLGRAARERARRYSLKAMADGYCRIYRELTQTAPRRSSAPESLLELRP